MQQSARIGECFFFPAGQVIHAKSHCRRQYSLSAAFGLRQWIRCFTAAAWTDARLQASLNITNPIFAVCFCGSARKLRNPALRRRHD